MYFAHSPHLVSRRIVAAPVNAPKNTVLVSTATGAARSIVGVPTLPSIASTPFAPRFMPVVDTGMLPAIDALVDGQIGDVHSTLASTSARAFCSARFGS